MNIPKISSSLIPQVQKTWLSVIPQIQNPSLPITSQTQNPSLAIIPQIQKCQKRSKPCCPSHIIFSEVQFYCDACQIYTKWNFNTKLESSVLHSSLIEKLLLLFLANKTPTEALQTLTFSLNEKVIHITTVRRYFTNFCELVLDFYQNNMKHLLLEQDVEIDESHLFREKKSSAPHRQYKLRSIWLFGMKQRNSSKFLLIPLKDRKEDTLIPIIKRHVKVGSNIYSDSFSVYVNNKTKESKLQRYKSYLKLN